MGAGEKNVQIGAGSGIMLLVNMMAEIRPLLIDEGLDFQQGLILFGEENAICNRVQRAYQEAGAEICKSIKKNSWKIPNNKIGIHPFNSYDGEREIFEFLGIEAFTPIILVSGMIPDNLRRYCVIAFEKGEDIEAAPFLRTLEGFRSYIFGNPDILQRTIRLCKTAEFLKQSNDDPLYIGFMVTLEAYSNYYRESHDEAQTRDQALALKQMVSDYLRRSEYYTEELESTDDIKKALELYVEENPQIKLGNVKEIDGALMEAIQLDHAILYDDKFYYIPEEILRCACKPFLDVVSILGVKRALRKSGALYCNNGKDGNFTVKKMLTNVFGYSFRPRFLYIRKEFFKSDDSLGLEERRGACTLEN